MSLDIVNENSTAYLTVQFLDKDGNQDTPSSVSYRVDCLTNGQEVRGDTSSSAASEIEITLTPSDNAILDEDNDYERRLVTVTAVFGTNDQSVQEFEYAVKNMRKI